jgi:hypothetical protein
VTRALILAALAAACALAIAAPADAAKARNFGFAVTGARISEVMTFHGDGGPACARAGVCGYSGTVSYGFDHASGIAVFTLQGRHASGFGSFLIGGLTAASVQAPGGGPPCIDKVLRKFDDFEVEGKPGKVRLLFHAPVDAPDFLETYCAGPSDLDMAHARAIPEIDLPGRMLRRKSLLLQTSSTRPFHAGPFEGTLAFTVSVRLRSSRQVNNLLELISFG